MGRNSQSIETVTHGHLFLASNSISNRQRKNDFSIHAKNTIFDEMAILQFLLALLATLCCELTRATVDMGKTQFLLFPQQIEKYENLLFRNRYELQIQDGLSIT